MRTPVLLATAAALVLTAAAPAFAQTAQAGAPADGQAHGHHAGHQQGEWRARFAAMRQQRMQDLHTVLRIRPEQDAAWQAYQASMTPPDRMHGPGGEHGQRGEHGKGAEAMAQGTPQTTPQALDRMAAWQAKREQRMAARTDATKRFYAALSPEQQQVFDALRRLDHHGHRGGGHGGHGRMGGMEQGQG